MQIIDRYILKEPNLLLPRVLQQGQLVLEHLEGAGVKVVGGGGEGRRVAVGVAARCWFFIATVYQNV